MRRTLLDIGTGAGDLPRRLMARGFDAYGVDISEYAIGMAKPEMRDRLALADISQAPALPAHFPEQFDLVLATDLWEHVYADDLDRAFNWMLSKARSRLFFCIAITHGEEFIQKKGEPIPLRWEATAAAGHVHVRHPRWWMRYFLSKGLKIDWASMYLFQMEREKDAGWMAARGWDLASTYVLRKA